MDTKFSEIRPIIAQGVILATLGVLLTAIFTGVIIWWVLGMTVEAAGIGFLTSLLFVSLLLVFIINYKACILFFYCNKL